ncbi:hypothetical protein PYCCODRAFT_1259472 [Trametes coccinea BRFM310]|uniref:Uncharacterized protein n=1 Tax=Trametes coccinea (strain BRFM310) TaxID=1353009 RepID=A0A1Y2I857_TRAC3|nr:hypothetical protein PYCCODRAFT_1259472 [Trametes coccinea BRFM310]
MSSYSAQAPMPSQPSVGLRSRRTRRPRTPCHVTHGPTFAARRVHTDGLGRMGVRVAPPGLGAGRHARPMDLLPPPFSTVEVPRSGSRDENRAIPSAAVPLRTVSRWGPIGAVRRWRDGQKKGAPDFAAEHCGSAVSICHAVAVTRSGHGRQRGRSGRDSTRGRLCTSGESCHHERSYRRRHARFAGTQHPRSNNSNLPGSGDRVRSTRVYQCDGLALVIGARRRIKHEPWASVLCNSVRATVQLLS